MSNKKDMAEPWETLQIAKELVEMYEEAIISLRESNAALRRQLRKYKALSAIQEEEIRSLSKHVLH